MIRKPTTTPLNGDGSDPARRAERFKRVRDAHQTELAEDYVELIADLIEEKGE
ncbi:MAG: transcriptional regulator MntR, partial [Hyphomicrobium sp.]|nr:transcriptional regulator MntR [Hyphomicrobium sp.]